MNLREQLWKDSRQPRASSREPLTKLGSPEAAEPPCESMQRSTPLRTSHHILRGARKLSSLCVLRGKTAVK